MDLLKLIIDAEALNSTCFLCFKLCNNGKSIYDNIEMRDMSLNFAVKTSLWNIIKQLFPYEIILFRIACNPCVEDLKKIYFKLQMRSFRIDNLIHIVDVISETISRTSSDAGKIMIELPLSLAQISNDDVKKEIKTGSVGHQSCNLNVEPKLTHDQKLCLQNNKSDSKICHICGKTCSTSKLLKAHMNCHTTKECPYCKKILKTHSHFNKHVKSHQKHVKRKRKQIIYNCDSCSYVSSNKTDLESHKYKSHLGIRPYQCEICLKSFHKKSNLTSHILSHNKKKLICEICGNSFSFKKTLIQHLKLHAGLKNYDCEHCKRKFVTLSRRNEHVKRNHSNKIHTCQYCGRKYALKKDLNTHIKKIHNDLIFSEKHNHII